MQDVTEALPSDFAGFPGADAYRDFTFSCVVDSSFKFQMQVEILVATLTKLGGIPGPNIVVHTVAELDCELERYLRQVGVSVRAIQPFAGHPYCNKISQLAALTHATRPFVVMLDCDTAITRATPWPKPQRIAAKRVDTATPPPSVLSGIFAAAKLGKPRWTESDLLPGGEGRETDVNNCNGGVYIVERGFLDRLAPVWMKWAQWCLDTKGAFGPYAMHIDQVSLALACQEMNLDIEPLHRRFNMPTHLTLSPAVDVDPYVLHYHSQFDGQFLLRRTGALPSVDAAIQRVNECLSSKRRESFLNAVFFGARYELFPELGAGIGSRRENLKYKRNVLNELVTSSTVSVIDVGCGDLEVSSGLPVADYVGVDIAASAIQAAARRRPEWDFVVGNASELDLEPRDLVCCFDVLIHQPTRAEYEKLAQTLCRLANDTLIIGAYDGEPAFTSSITFYYEPITQTLDAAGKFGEISVVGKYRDVSVVVARVAREKRHDRDLSARDFNRASLVTDHPLLLRLIVDESRRKIGFFPAHTPRALEYPWILANLPRDLKGISVLDVGAGVNPLPSMLADRQAEVFTIDNHSLIRDIDRKSEWNEWGFLDYSRIDGRIESAWASYEEWHPGRSFDYIYCVSVIEHLPVELRRRWISKFAAELIDGGSALLTVDVVPETDRLWNYREGRIVEEEHLHGTVADLAHELRAAGFVIQEQSIKRNIPGSRVDVAFVRAIRLPRPSRESAGLPSIAGRTDHSVDRIGNIPAPNAASSIRLAGAEVLSVEGWAVDSVARRLASAIEVVVDGIPYKARYGIDRPDVAAYFHEPEYLKSGFRVDLPERVFGAGRHEVTVRVISARGDGYWEVAALAVQCLP